MVSYESCGSAEAMRIELQRTEGRVKAILNRIAEDLYWYRRRNKGFNPCKIFLSRALFDLLTCYNRQAVVMNREPGDSARAELFGVPVEMFNPTRREEFQYFLACSGGTVEV